MTEAEQELLDLVVAQPGAHKLREDLRARVLAERIKPGAREAWIALKRERDAQTAEHKRKAAELFERYNIPLDFDMTLWREGSKF